MANIDISVFMMDSRKVVIMNNNNSRQRECLRFKESWVNVSKSNQRESQYLEKRRIEEVDAPPLQIVP